MKAHFNFIWIPWWVGLKVALIAHQLSWVSSRKISFDQRPPPPYVRASNLTSVLKGRTRFVHFYHVQTSLMRATKRQCMRYNNLREELNNSETSSDHLSNIFFVINMTAMKLAVMSPGLLYTWDDKEVFQLWPFTFASFLPWQHLKLLLLPKVSCWVTFSTRYFNFVFAFWRRPKCCRQLGLKLSRKMVAGKTSVGAPALFLSLYPHKFRTRDLLRICKTYLKRCTVRIKNTPPNSGPLNVANKFFGPVCKSLCHDHNDPCTTRI